MTKISAGILPYCKQDNSLHVFLVHSGGPEWIGRDERAWSIAKGQPRPGESLRDSAIREFREEIGVDPPVGEYLELGMKRQPSRKRLTVFAVQGVPQFEAIRSNLFETEWPPRSNIICSFPEVDRAEWFKIEEARIRLYRGQVPFLDRLWKRLDVLGDCHGDAYDR